MFNKVLKWKKKSAALLALALVASLSLQPMNAKAAAAKPAPTSVITLSIEDDIQVLVLKNTYQLEYTLSSNIAKEKVKFISSDPSVAKVSATGKITPVKKGYVTITATTKKGQKASKDFCVINDDYTTSYQSTVDKMLASSNISKIILKNMKTTSNYTIKPGDYSNKTLDVNAPYSGIKNYGTFKQINIIDIAGKWREYAKGNTFQVTDSFLNFVVDKKSEVAKIDVAKDRSEFYLLTRGFVDNFQVTGNKTEVTVEVANKAQVKTMQVTGKDAKVMIMADGSFDKLIIDSNAQVEIVGSTKQVAIEVTKNAKGAIVKTSVAVKATVAADATFVLKDGSQASVIEKTSDSVALSVTAAAVSSNGGKTATYTLPVPIKSLKSATVSVNGSVQKDYKIEQLVLSYVNSLLSKESFYLDLWESKNNISVTKGNLTVTAKGSGATKEVNFDGLLLTVTLNRTANTITVVRKGSNVTYTLSKTNYNVLTVTSNTNTKVVDLLSFQVTY